MHQTVVNTDAIIGKETFFGSQSVIVNGVEITSGCVIGAGSLVRKKPYKKGLFG